MNRPHCVAHRQRTSRGLVAVIAVHAQAGPDEPQAIRQDAISEGWDELPASLRSRSDVMVLSYEIEHDDLKRLARELGRE